VDQCLNAACHRASVTVSLGGLRIPRPRGIETDYRQIGLRLSRRTGASDDESSSGIRDDVESTLTRDNRPMVEIVQRRAGVPLMGLSRQGSALLGCKGFMPWWSGDMMSADIWGTPLASGPRDRELG
jgi:hypothetical protein